MDLHTVMPLIDYPHFEEVLVKNSMVYANSVLNINTDFFSTIVEMLVRVIYDFVNHAKRLTCCAKKGNVRLKLAFCTTCVVRVLVLAQGPSF